MPVIIVGAPKGGTGKTTTAVNLAVELAVRGNDVMLLDADIQGSSANFIERRHDAGGEFPVVHCTQKTGNIYRTVLDLDQRYDYVVIDCPGRYTDSNEFRSGMLGADIVVMPLRPSQQDLETLPKAIELRDDALAGRAALPDPTLPTLVTLTLAPTNPRVNELEGARAYVAAFDEITASDAVLHDRKAYRDAMLAGLGVVETTNAQAAAEVRALTDEILAKLA